MDKENLIKILDKLDKPISKIESDLGMPSGTLAKAKKGVRGLPNKWSEPLNKYFLESGTLSKQTNVDNKKNDWVKEIEDFCEKENITPQDLIIYYKNKAVKKESNPTPQTETFFDKLRKKKLGY